jgi:hypothetical protein
MAVVKFYGCRLLTSKFVSLLVKLHYLSVPLPQLLATGKGRLESEFIVSALLVYAFVYRSEQWSRVMSALVCLISVLVAHAYKKYGDQGEPWAAVAAKVTPTLGECVELVIVLAGYAFIRYAQSARENSREGRPPDFVILLIFVSAGATALLLIFAALSIFASTLLGVLQATF